MQVHAMWLLIPSWVGGNLVPSLCEEEEMSLGMRLGGRGCSKKCFCSQFSECCCTLFCNSLSSTKIYQNPSFSTKTSLHSNTLYHDSTWLLLDSTTLYGFSWTKTAVNSLATSM